MDGQDAARAPGPNAEGKINIDTGFKKLKTNFNKDNYSKQTNKRSQTY